MAADSAENQTAPAAESVRPYDGDAPKGKLVEQMFDSIAPAYDFMNGAMTFGLHRLWRARALRRALSAQGVRRAMTRPEGADILDVATGTGDLALHLVHKLPKGRITGVDLSEGMLAEARRKLARLPLQMQQRVSFSSGDCLDLKFPDNSFDLITVAYGVRNFEHLADGLREMHRVLRPGGTLCILELSVPSNPLLRLGYNIYARHLIPAVGRLVSGDSDAYSYLPRSIAACPQRRDMTLLMERAGLSDCSFRSMTFGVVTLYLAHK